MASAHQQLLMSYKPGVSVGALDGYTTGLSAAWSASRQLLTAYGGAFYVLTLGNISTLNDQSGASRNLTSVISTIPLSTSGPNSRTSGDMDAAGGGALVGAAMSNFISNSSGFMVFAIEIVAFPATGQKFIMIDQGVNETGIIIKSTSEILAYNWGAGSLTVATPATTGVHVITWRHESGNLAVSIDGAAEVVVASSNLAGMTGGFKIDDSDTKFVDVAVWSTVPSASDRAAIIADFKTYLGVP